MQAVSVARTAVAGTAARPGGAPAVVRAAARELAVHSLLRPPARVTHPLHPFLSGVVTFPSLAADERHWSACCGLWRRSACTHKCLLSSVNRARATMRGLEAFSERVRMGCAQNLRHARVPFNSLTITASKQPHPPRPAPRRESLRFAGGEHGLVGVGRQPARGAQDQRSGHPGPCLALHHAVALEHLSPQARLKAPFPVRPSTVSSPRTVWCLVKARLADAMRAPVLFSSRPRGPSKPAGSSNPRARRLVGVLILRATLRDLRSPEVAFVLSALLLSLLVDFVLLNALRNASVDPLTHRFRILPGRPAELASLFKHEFRGVAIRESYGIIPPSRPKEAREELEATLAQVSGDVFRAVAEHAPGAASLFKLQARKRPRPTQTALRESRGLKPLLRCLVLPTRRRASPPREPRRSPTGTSPCRRRTSRPSAGTRRAAQSPPLLPPPYATKSRRHAAAAASVGHLSPAQTRLVSSPSSWATRRRTSCCCTTPSSSSSAFLSARAAGADDARAPSLPPLLLPPPKPGAS